MGPHMLHFWHSAVDFGYAEQSTPFPLYVHQKKKPGRTWYDVMTFRQPLGGCVPFRIMQETFPRDENMTVWHLPVADPPFLARLDAVEDAWEAGWHSGRAKMEE